MHINDDRPAAHGLGRRIDVEFLLRIGAIGQVFRCRDIGARDLRVQRHEKRQRLLSHLAVPAVTDGADLGLRIGGILAHRKGLPAKRGARHHHRGNGNEAHRILPLPASRLSALPRWYRVRDRNQSAAPSACMYPQSRCCQARKRVEEITAYSTVTLFARFRGWSTSVPLAMATW
jgi:hypothetical protein